MNPLTALVDWLEATCDERTLAWLSVALAAGLATALLFGAWYVGSLGLTLGQMGYEGDDRTVVIDAPDHDQFARHYDDDREEGWCLYGTSNETHVVVTEVVHARPLSQDGDHVTFTCIPETLGQIATADDPRLVGAVHSHPSYDSSWLSYKDVMLWGQVAPFTEVMGVYTDRGGVAFFSVESMHEPLNVTVVGDGTTANGTAAGRERAGIETP